MQLEEKSRNLDYREKLLQKEDDLKVEEEKTKYGEVLEDDLLENINEFTNKRSSTIIENIASFLVTFIGGGITYAITKKWGIIHG